MSVEAQHEQEQYEKIILAPEPQPSRFLSWCLSSRFSFIRKRAQARRDNHIKEFRREESVAIKKAMGVHAFVSSYVQKNENLSLLTHVLSLITQEHQEQAREISKFPAVRNIFSWIGELILDKVEGILKAEAKKLELPAVHQSPIKRKKAQKEEVPGFQEFMGVEVNHTPSPLKK